MMLTRRIWLTIGLALFIGAGAVLVWQVWPDSDDFGRIRLGMTDKEVLEILGPPGDYDSSISSGMWAAKSLTNDDSKRFLKSENSRKDNDGPVRQEPDGYINRN